MGAGEGGRTEVAQGTRHLGFPQGTVVTCQWVSLGERCLESLSARRVGNGWRQLSAANQTRGAMAWPTGKRKAKRG